MNPFEGYKITSPYGPRNDPFTGLLAFHTGIDLVLADKAPIKAFMGGKVIHAKEGVQYSGFGNFGNVVAILDVNNAIQFYAHLYSISVKLGDQVVKGQVVGLQGNTGHSAGSHCHYEVRLSNTESFGFGSSTEPTAYLQKYMDGVAPVTKYNPPITKERIIAVNGKLKYISLVKTSNYNPYSVKGTDVRFMKFDKTKISMQLITQKGAKVSQLVKAYSADYGINYPFFDSSSKTPVALVWDGKKYINGDYGKTLKWRPFSYKNGNFIGSITLGKDEVESSSFVVKGSPTLVSNGLAVWDYCSKLEETANDIARDASGNLVRCQRTFVGIDKDGNLLVGISDGRTGSDMGLTIEEMALYMIDKGAVWAQNGDGGSSTILANQSGGLNQAENVGKNERPVHHAMLIYLK